MSTYCIILDPLAGQDAACAVGAEYLINAMTRIGYEEASSDRAEVTIKTHCVKGQEEEFVIEPLKDGKGLQVSGTPAGAAYGLVSLSERLTIDGPNWELGYSSKPAFSERMFSEEGQLLAFPDWGFWSDDPPYVNEEVLDEEIEEVKRLVPHLVRNGFNAFCLAHMNVDEYIDYQYVGRPVLRENDRHRDRSKVFCSKMTDLIEYFHRHHIKVYVQVYEFSYPYTMAEHELVETYEGRNKFYAARYREFFERVPYDGVVMTVGEPHCRAGYLGKHVIKRIPPYEYDAADAAPLADFMHELISEQLGKRLYFRLWGYCTARASFDVQKWRSFSAALRSKVDLASKSSNGDFWIHQNESPLFHEPTADGRISMYIFDGYRQYEGWGEMFCVPKDWGARLRLSLLRGARCVNMWGPWSGYLHYTGAVTPVDWPLFGSWRGVQSHHHVFTRGFKPGEANVYLFGRLAWDPECSIEQAAHDWAVLHYGERNASAVREILELSEIPWRLVYLKGERQANVRNVTTFQYDPEKTRSFLTHNTLEEVEAKHDQALSTAKRIAQLSEGADEDAVPNPEALSALRRGTRLGELYFGVLMRYIANLFRERQMEAASKEEQSRLLSSIKTSLDEMDDLFESWSSFEPEASDWNITASPKWREDKMVTLKDRAMALRKRWNL